MGSSPHARHCDKEVVTRDGWSAAELIGVQKSATPRCLGMGMVATVARDAAKQAALTPPA